MPKSKRLIIGLGNPGPEYERTRHNIGFQVADAVAEKARITFTRERGDVLLGWGRMRGYPFGVAKPQTFMNRSGRAVYTLVQRYGLETQEMLVVVDDINLPPGTIRIRPNGSAGGHNGLQDIIDSLSTADFPRLRFGIGSNFSRGRQADYVLSPFSEEEQPVVEEARLRARDAALTFVSDGVVTTMNRFNK
ncbi:MAG TPA: aminoacyl-tRNA hydrolase [Rhodothermales bacterium]|nr:aminoacyl-tRNA hydrolase [Rhodothermales bacterium]